MSVTPLTPTLRRLVVLVSAVMLGDTIFFSAITPLLPGYARDLDLGATGAGLLEASYAAGTLAAAVPAGILAARFGVRRTVLVGLSLLACGSVGFGFADSVVLLDLTRFVQGIGGACSWAGGLAWLVRVAPAGRRGELIGTALGAAIAGALLGPAVGAAAAALGTEVVFCLAAVLAAGLATWTLRVPAPGTRSEPPAALLSALRDPRLAGGVALVVLPAVLFAAIGVLGPLHLDALGAGATAIGVAFFASAAAEAITSPLVGRLSDRLGRLTPIRVGLLVAGPLLIALPRPGSALVVAIIVVLCAPAIGASWAPAMAMLTDGAQARDVDPAIAISLMNAAWGLGALVGGVGAGRLADAVGFDATFAVLGGVCLAVGGGLVAVDRRSRAGVLAGGPT